VIRIDAIWLAVEPMDMRAGTESALGRVVAVFGSAQPHHAYVFLNRRGLQHGVCTKAASRELRSPATWHSRGCSSMR
jgi:hypothetical protein